MDDVLRPWPDGYVNLADYAASVPTSVRTIGRWRAKGLVKTLTIGRHVLVDVAETHRAHAGGRAAAARPGEGVRWGEAAPT